MKYLFSTDNTNLIITLDTESGKYNPEITTVNDPNITLENDRIWFYENGKYIRNFPFYNIGTISGVTPTTIQDAFDKINEIIATLSTSSINTAFTNKAYSATMNIAFDSANPNFEIDLTGNLDLTITGTSNGDSGMVNLYFSATETATLNGFTDLVVAGDGEMIPIYFIHDSDGLKWYNDVTGGAVDTSTLALQDGTILYHLAVATNIGTFSNVGNVCTGIGTSITNEMIGAKIKKANGEIGIIATRTSNTEFTTEVDFLTDSVDTTFEVRCIEHKINIDGSVNSFDKIGVLRSYMEENGTISNNYLSVQTNGNITTDGYQFNLQGTVFLNGAGYVIAPFFKNRVIYTAATLPLASDVGNGVHAFVSDALAPTYLGILVGGGTINCAVFSNGTDWITH